MLHTNSGSFFQKKNSHKKVTVPTPDKTPITLLPPPCSILQNPDDAPDVGMQDKHMSAYLKTIEIPLNTERTVH